MRSVNSLNWYKVQRIFVVKFMNYQSITAKVSYQLYSAASILSNTMKLLSILVLLSTTTCIFTMPTPSPGEVEDCIELPKRLREGLIVLRSLTVSFILAKATAQISFPTDLVSNTTCGASSPPHWFQAANDAIWDDLLCIWQCLGCGDWNWAFLQWISSRTNSCYCRHS